MISKTADAAQSHLGLLLLHREGRGGEKKKHIRLLGSAHLQKTKMKMKMKMINRTEEKA